MAEEYIYGVNPAFEVMHARRRRIHQAYLLDSLQASGRMRKVATLLESRAVPISRATKQQLFRLCGTTEHQGMVLATDPYPYAAFDSLMACPRLLLLDNVEDPQNVGAILRSAEVFGWKSVLLSAKGVPAVYPSVVKAAAGATEHLQITRDHAANAYVRQLLAQEYVLVALDEHGKEDIQVIRDQVHGKLLLVIGGEHRSVGQHILNQARHIVGIRQQGRIQSLNASVAAGIALFMLGGMSLSNGRGD